MINLRFNTISLVKRVALTISRGVSTGSQCAIVELECDGIVGYGEAAEFEIPGVTEDYKKIEAELVEARVVLAERDPFDRYAIESLLKSIGIGSAVRNAIDMALWDWAGKAVQLPVWKLVGISRHPRSPTSVTIGLGTPAFAVERLKQWESIGKVGAIKIKLGNPLGIQADKEMFQSVHEVINSNVRIGVDANGGWELRDAIEMSQWLYELGVEHIEQPLAVGQEHDLSGLFRQSPLPIFIDESCLTTADVIRWSQSIHGINIKLTKCGGITEALRMIAAAQSLGLKTMIGCYGNTTLGNAAANQLTSMIDYIDLDSHLNLINDPFVGLKWENGYLLNRQCDIANQSDPTELEAPLAEEQYGLGVKYA